MLKTVHRWRRKRALATLAIPDELWRESVAALPFLGMYDEPTLQRLRERAVLFLAAKSIVAANGYAVTPRMRVIIAIQACVLALNLDEDVYEGWENVIVYPDAFVPAVEYVDEAGVVHPNAEPFAGEALRAGPVVLSWRDVEASADWTSAGMNLVIHEFAHKLDMQKGEATGCPPLPAELSPRSWQAAMRSAFADFAARVEAGEDTEIDPYAAESPAEFFAVLSEVFFSDAGLLVEEYPEVYELLARYYRQDPAGEAHPGPAA